MKISPSVAGLGPVPRTMDSIEPRFKVVGEEYSALLMSSKLSVDFSISLLAIRLYQRNEKNRDKKNILSKKTQRRVQLLEEKLA